MNDLSDVIYSNQENTTVTFAESIKLPTDIIVHGVSMKQTILDVLNECDFDECDKESLAEDIKLALAVKLKMFQGKL